MSLTSALNSARNSLAVRSSETDVVSRNIAGVNDPGYSRKTADVSVGAQGSVRLVQVSRSADQALFGSVLRSTSDASTQQALLTGINQLQQTVDPSMGAATPAGRVASLIDGLQQLAAAPDNQNLAANAITSARDLVQTMHDATDTVQSVRKVADSDIATSVSNINSLLSQFETVNAKIVSDAGSGRDITDQLDARDQLLSKISSEIGIRTTTRANSDMQIYTDGGATLFDRTPRVVSFQPTLQYTAATQGNAVIVDGTPVTGPGAVMTAQSGRIAGLTQLRDDVAVKYQGQLDEIARGLITSLSETDTTGASSSARAGLFRVGTSTALPGSALEPGLAGLIQVASSADPAQGSNPMLLRDGGISDPTDPNYKINATGAAAFSDRLESMISGLNAAQSFDSSGGAMTTGAPADYASSSVGWIESLRQSTTDASDQKSTTRDRAQQSLAGVTGVSLDNEMSKMLDLERAYQGSAKLISVVDSMLQAILQAVG
jgi:flagellar hook-associated protein 1 FlgK